MVGCTIERDAIVLSNEHVKCWVPETKFVAGIKWVKIDKWCRGFVKFITGRSLDLRKKKKFNINISFMDALFDTHAAACADAVKKAFEVDDEDGDIGTPRKYRKRMKPVGSHKELVGDYIEFTMGNVTHEGISKGPLTMKALFEGNPKTNSRQMLWIEAVEANFDYLEHAINAGLKEGESKGRGWQRGAHCREARMQKMKRRQNCSGESSGGVSDNNDEDIPDEQGADEDRTLSTPNSATGESQSSSLTMTPETQQTALSE